MTVTAVPNQAEDVSAQLVSLAAEASSSLEALKAIDPSTLTAAVLFAQLSDLFGIVTDLASFSARFATEQIDWAEGVDEDLDDLKAPSSQLLPPDSMLLKMLLGDLSQALPDDASSAALKARVAAAVLFIDEITIDEDDEGEGDEGETEEDEE